MSFRSEPPAEVPRLVQIGRTDRMPPVVLEVRARGRVAAAGRTVALHALEGVEHLLAPAERRIRGRDFLRHHRRLELRVLVGLGEGLDVGDDRRALLLGERPPGGHRRSGHPLRDDVEEILVRRQRPDLGADLELPGGEVARAGHQELGRRPVALAVQPVASARSASRTPACRAPRPRTARTPRAGRGCRAASPRPLEPRRRRRRVGLHHAGRMARGLVEEVDDLPDLLLGEPLFPGRHRRVPGRRLLRQARAALRDAPEHEALGELGDRVRADEVGRRRVEPVGEVPLPVEEVAVAVDAVPDVGRRARREVLLPVRGILLDVLPDRGVGVLEVDLLPAEADRRGRRRVGRAELERRLGDGRRLGVRVVADEERDQDPQQEPQGPPAGLGEHRPDRGDEGPPRVGVRRDVDEDGDHRDGHVEGEHAERHGRLDAVPEQQGRPDDDQDGLEELSRAAPAWARAWPWRPAARRP